LFEVPISFEFSLEISNKAEQKLRIFFCQKRREKYIFGKTKKKFFKGQIIFIRQT